MATKTNTQINSRDYYRIVRTIGHKYVDGKRIPIRKQFYGTSKANAEKKYDAYLKEQARQKYEDQRALDITTFGERAEQYVQTVLRVTQKYSAGTKDRYEQSYRTHVKGCVLSDLIARDIKAADIQQFYNDLDVSQQTIRQIHKFMSALYKWLALNEYAPNVLTAVEIPAKQDNAHHDGIIVWSDEEIDALTSQILSHRLCFLVYLLLYTGMRISEALGLKYADVDGDVIHVVRQYNLDEIKPPKFGSARDIPMHKDLIPIYEAHKAWHEEEMEKKGYHTEYVFTSRTGHLLNYMNVRRSLIRFYRAHDIEPKHIHAYRSTFCTQLCKCGVPLEIASKLLGHKSLEVTAAHYALVSPETKRDAIDALKYSIKN